MRKYGYIDVSTKYLQPMQALTTFYEKLTSCDLLVLTPVTEDRSYCRFYSCGVYLDRLFITDKELLSDLKELSLEDEVIDAEGVRQLIEKYGAILNKAQEETL
ncbi:hypothetical protein FVR03_20635 [Pontibacter qinzhouensis]|uniref:Uncharacterized protein n=1 Tax=Pontibacter qinzhouensis TaxID=2603253 RepID=A0A5C8J1I3_9BACT|nr:hypothetical protein [Pontibacter qinzhouensis]TXK29476.1 hypothetical protein FVR03_20635 [Pontibacter qinzhouensis]